MALKRLRLVRVGSWCGLRRLRARIAVTGGEERNGRLGTPEPHAGGIASAPECARRPSVRVEVEGERSNAGGRAPRGRFDSSGRELLPGSQVHHGALPVTDRDVVRLGIQGSSLEGGDPVARVAITVIGREDRARADVSDENSCV